MVSTDFPWLVHVKSWKNCGTVYVMSAYLGCRPRRSLYPLRRARSLLRGSAYNLMQVFLTFAFLSKNEINEWRNFKQVMFENSRRLAELKWIVPVDFVWTADLRWHYINWWKTRKQRIRDENVTTEGSSWWYSTIYLMLKNHSVLLTNWRSSDYQTWHKKQNQNRLPQKLFAKETFVFTKNVQPQLGFTEMNE